MIAAGRHSDSTLSLGKTEKQRNTLFSVFFWPRFRCIGSPFPEAGFSHPGDPG
jgi:hypothetical protein